MSVLQQVIEVVADTLNLPAESLHISSSAESLPAWDSLAHVNLMIALEQTFDIQLEVEDFPTLNSVAAIQEYLVSHGAG
jgi:acyl carrier protein